MESKICNVCKIDKPLAEFYLYKAKPRSACKTCYLQKGREVSKKHYLENKEHYKQRNRDSDQAIKAYVRNSKDNKKCVDCKRTYRYWMLDYDHRPGTVKLCELSHSFYLATIKKVQEEIDKCDLVCTNCHRDRTYTRHHSEESIRRWYESD